MGRVERVAADNKTRAALESFNEKREEFLASIVAVQQIPSPTFAEAERARHIQEMFTEIGLANIYQDSLHNVYGRLPGSNPKSHVPVIVSAHSDTVFPIETDLTATRDATHLYGPGIGDNSTGVAGLFAIAGTMLRHELHPAADIWFVSNVGEEGLGDLSGMREIVRRFGHRASYIVVEGGLYGQIAHEAIGVRRFRIDVKTAGGHSWGSFGAPSAIHELARLITEIDAIDVSEKPKTTYNAGLIEGGTSINTIASQASMFLDLRSESADELNTLVENVKSIIDRAQTNAVVTGRSVEFVCEQVGSRPAGQIPRSTPLVRWAQEALTYSGCRSIMYVTGSTDANIPLSMGIPSVCVGLTESENSHRLDERIDTGLVVTGLRQLLLLVLAASNY